MTSNYYLYLEPSDSYYFLLYLRVLSFTIIIIKERR